jgi:hypothetical protein
MTPAIRSPAFWAEAEASAPMRSTINNSTMKISISCRILFLLFLLISVKLLVAQVSLEEIKSMVHYLSDDDKYGRKNGSPQSAIISGWIKKYFESNGIEPFHGDYFQYYTHVDDDSITVRERNVVGLLKSTDHSDQEYFIVSAHFDHLGTKSGEGDSIYNGANDNATGVALLLSLILELNQIANRPYNLIFVAFSGEEMGLQGSASFANNLPVPREKIRLNLNFEMLGRTDSIEPRTYFITGSDYTNLKEVIRDFNKGENWKLDTSSSQHLLYLLSDNYSFVATSQQDTLKIPAHTFSIDTPDAPNYHSVEDEAPVIDYENLLGFARYSARLIDYLGRNKIEIRWLKEIQYEFELDQDSLHFHLIKKK